VLFSAPVPNHVISPACRPQAALIAPLPLIQASKC